MDQNITEYSDSDSGDSWTILEASNEFVECVPQLPTNSKQRLPSACNDKDEDTDGISIISDSDHESPSCNKNLHDCFLTEEDILSARQVPTHFPITHDNANNKEDINFEKDVGPEKDYLIEGNGKLKTYVHKRNKRLSTVLNIIMLGSVITAAGVAIGHMWGAKNDCSMHHTPRINKILSNLYKLQEENTYLRTKLKELTLLTNSRIQQPKMPVKERCKRVFEEPLENNNANKLTKCIDKNIEYDKDLESHLEEPIFEKDFLSEVNKLKKVYKQNKYWLDEEIRKRIKHEEQFSKNSENYAMVAKVNNTNTNNGTLIPINAKISLHDETEVLKLSQQNIYSETDSINKKISYADSLKSGHKLRDIQKSEVDKKWTSECNNKLKKNVKKNFEPNIDDILSDEEIKKDDRYNCHKCKYNKKKTDKWRKKQKRRDKLEQLDVKDLVEDYDNSHGTRQGNSNLFEKTHKVNDKEEKHEHLNENAIKGKQKINENHADNYNKTNWFEKRALLRKEYRKKLEQELLGEKTFNDSGWYFRRMKKREQCRAKTQNETHKKTSKLNMNFKMKY